MLSGALKPSEVSALGPPQSPQALLLFEWESCQDKDKEAEIHIEFTLNTQGRKVKGQYRRGLEREK